MEKNEEKEKIKCKAVVMACGSRSNSDVEELIKSTGIPCSVIGDAKHSGKMMTAIREVDELAEGI